MCYKKTARTQTILVIGAFAFGVFAFNMQNMALTQQKKANVPFPSLTPHQVFSTDAAQQEKELKDNVLIKRFETGLAIKHAAKHPGWTKQGVMPAHFVLQSPDDWALMLFSHKVNENFFTLERSFAANKKGQAYAILLDVGPGVYAMPSRSSCVCLSMATSLACLRTINCS